MKNWKNSSFDSALDSHTFARSSLRMTGEGHGLFIAIEGIDGSGKSVLAQTLATELKKTHPVLLTKEPGGSQLGKQLRTILQEHKDPIDPKAEFLLFAADRAQHFTEIIIPHLEKNYIVISDRCADSSLVYQGYGRGLNKELIKTINAWAMQNIKPDITLYVHIDAHTAVNRFNNRETNLSRFEQEKTEFFEKLICGYQELYHNRSDVITIDGRQSKEAVARETLEKVSKYLKI